MNEAEDVKPPLLVIAGATATGKSALAVRLAEAFDGEIVNADAYSLYRGMDVGTAKPDAGMLARVPHHLIDVTGPDGPLALARYLDLANAALDDIWSRGKLPLLVGGSGQYVWALIEGWRVPRVPPDPALRAELETLAAEQGIEALRARLAAVDLEAAARLDGNVRRLVRAVEVVTRTGLPLSVCQTRQPIEADVLVLGLRLPREVHYPRLDARVEEQLASGLVGEVQSLRAQGYGDTAGVRGGVGYKELSAYLDGEYGFDEAVRRAKNANHRLVRRQDAWFKENDPRIRWLDAETDPYGDAAGIVQAWLASRSEDEGRTN